MLGQGWRTYGTRARCGTPKIVSGTPLDILILISFNSEVFNLFYTIAPFRKVWVLIGFNSSDGRVVKASASGAVDLGLIPSRVKPMNLKLVFTAQNKYQF